VDIDQCALCRRQPVEEGEQARDHWKSRRNLIYLTSIKQRRATEVLDYRTLLECHCPDRECVLVVALVTTRGALSLERSYWRPTEK